jgi:hypothetical protein
MKELKEGELINMAYFEIRKMDINFWSQIILSCLMILESTLLLFGLISIIVFAVFWFLFLGLYLFHRHKSTKDQIKLQEILDELTSRNV